MTIEQSGEAGQGGSETGWRVERRGAVSVLWWESGARVNRVTRESLQVL